MQDTMKKLGMKLATATALVALLLIVTGSNGLAADNKNLKEPAVISPGPVGGPPSDAIVLFDGKDLS